VVGAHTDPAAVAARARPSLPLDTAVGVAAHQLFLLGVHVGVHADDRLAGGQMLLGLLVHIPKLRVPVGMLGTFLGLSCSAAA
jgi:hypothetical protein